MGTPSFELNAESKETKVQKKQWYAAHVLCITLIYYYYFSPKKLRGPEGGPGFVYTLVSLHSDSLLMEFWSLYPGCYQPNSVFSIFNVLLKIARYCPFNKGNTCTHQPRLKQIDLRNKLTCNMYCKCSWGVLYSVVISHVATIYNYPGCLYMYIVAEDTYLFIFFKLVVKCNFWISFDFNNIF